MSFDGFEVIKKEREDNVISFQDVKDAYENAQQTPVVRKLTEEQQIEEEERILFPLLVGIGQSSRIASFTNWLLDSNGGGFHQKEIEHIGDMAIRLIEQITDEYMEYIESTLSDAPVTINKSVDYWSDRAYAVIEGLAPVMTRAEKLYKSMGWTEEEFETAVQEAVEEREDVFTLILELIGSRLSLVEAGDRLCNVLLRNDEADILPPAVKKEWERLAWMSVAALNDSLMALYDVLDTIYEHEPPLTEDEENETYEEADHIAEINFDICESIWSLFVDNDDEEDAEDT